MNKENLFQNPDRFVNRHIGPDENDIREMLKTVGCSSLRSLIDETLPEDIRLHKELELGEPMSEYSYYWFIRALADRNLIFRSYIGLGYYGTYLPPVIQRNILENPGWYTAYTPYQAEISQGRLEALLNYQTMIVDLTGLPVANASLLDESTAAAEAMHMLYSARPPGKSKANKFFVSEECFPQTIDVLKTRSAPFNIELVIGSHKKAELTDDMFGILVQYPAANGAVYDYEELFRAAREKQIYTVTAADILGLTLLKPPGEFGGDVAVGSTQRFGVPMGYGGPHAAYFACREEFKRLVPGRIIGVSVDKYGKRAYRMALQTREQHIRREKATSNICTSQVLLAVMAGMYAVYHGPDMLRLKAEKVHNLARLLAGGLENLGFKQLNVNYFDTLLIDLGSGNSGQKSDELKKRALEKEINLNFFGGRYVGISLDETTELEDIRIILSVFDEKGRQKTSPNPEDFQAQFSFPESLRRSSKYLQHPVFNTFHSETELMRYIKRLENKDISLNTSMIPLGSCTMKLNASVQMLPVTWSKLASIHPFAPQDQAQGYAEVFKQLEDLICRVTGFSAVSLQPNSGAQGEYTGLMVIRQYHLSRGESERNVVLIPSSAHGTNPASAVMAGMKVIIIKTTENGDIDIDDLRARAESSGKKLSALMITYPSTHGVFEEQIKDICSIIHKNGGQVYMDGANLNAQLGLTSPALVGADVCHLNLHKTFCIPHGGGGPGMGPIAVAEHLAPFLPGHPLVNVGGKKAITAVSSAPWGSSSILPISLGYILMMGGKGLTYASEIAILNANYVKSKLEAEFPALYSGKRARVGHELIFDMRHFKRTANIDVEDIAKRLMDYGFHAPTVSFPVPGTLMFEPTESESKAELDRFCEAMLSIRNEIREVEEGSADVSDNVLKNAPHPAQQVVSDNWNHPYSREKAAYPLPWVRENKFWPPVGRIDNAYGDRNFVCSCEPVSSYAEENK